MITTSAFRSTLLVVGAMSLVAQPARAQQPANPDTSGEHSVSLALTTQRDASGGVTLRWGPGTPALWLHGNEAGYLVERAPVPRNANDAVTFERLTPVPLRPWAREQWQARAQGNRHAAMAVQMLQDEGRIDPAAGQLRELRDRAQLLRNRHGFALFAADMDSIAAEGLGLRLVDGGASAGVEYVYRVFFASPPDGESADTAYAFAPADPTTSPPPEGLRALVGDGRLGLAWDPGLPGSAYSAFVLERAEGDGPYVRLTETPLVVLDTPVDSGDAPRYVDEGLVNGRTYRYRLYGITPFATPSLPAEVVAVPRDLTPPPAPLVSSVEPTEGGFRVRWSIPEPSPDLAGFHVGIAATPDGPFHTDMERRLPPTAREAVDTRALPGGHNHYVIIAVDTAGNATPSVPVYAFRVDSMPPAPPVGLTARADTSGVVTVAWRTGAEPDLYAYRVFRMRQGDHVPVLQTGEPLIDSVYVDSVEVRTLTRDVFYEVVALDRNFNASAPARVQVVLPDMVPPVPPVASGVTPGPSAIGIAWVPSSSEDVARHHVLRRSGTEEGQSRGEWRVLAILPADAAQFRDTTVERGRRYEYAIVAEDSSGLRSAQSEPVMALAYDSGLREGVQGLTATSADGGVRLRWTLPPGNAERWVVVYRAAAGAALMPLRTLDAATTLEDGVPAGRYTYGVQVFHRDGGRSRIEEVTVEVEGSGR